MHYVYHPDHEAKVVDTQTYYKLLEDGWYDSPAKFPSAAAEQGLAAIVEKIEAPILKVVEEAEVSSEMENTILLCKVKADGAIKKKGRPALIK